MTTLNKIVYDILNETAGGRISDDTKITNRLIEEWVHQTRAELISNEMSKSRDITQDWVQTLGVVNMEKVDIAEHPLVKVKCYIMKSKKPIPTTIERVKRNSILSVESLDRETSISQTLSFRSKWNKWNKYTSSESRWYLKDSYLYITNQDLIAAVTLTGVFDNPSEVANFNYVNGLPCWTPDSDYPVSNKMASAIVELIKNRKIRSITGVPSDTENDSSGEIAQKK